MNRFQRLAARALGLEPMQTKAHPAGAIIAAHRLGRPIWTDRRKARYATVAYRQTPVANRAVRMVATALAGIEPVLKMGEKDLAEAHPAHRLLRRPNPFMDRGEFLASLVSDLLLEGNAYAVEVVAGGNGEGRGELRELWRMRPDAMECELGPTGAPLKYYYHQKGHKRAFEVDVDAGRLPVLHIREYAPDDDVYGMSALEPAMRSVDIYNLSTDYYNALLQNSAQPGGALKYSGDPDTGSKLSDEQFERLKREIEAMAGAKNTGRPLVLDGDLEWVPMGLSPVDISYLDVRRDTARDIALCFGVPPMLLGIPGDNTYSNYQEAQRALWRETVIPLATRIYGKLAAWLSRHYGEAFEIVVDLDTISALSGERLDTYAMARDATWLTTNERRELTGWEPLGPEGDAVFVSAADIPLERAQDEHEPEPEDDDLGDEDDLDDEGGDDIEERVAH